MGNAHSEYLGALSETGFIGLVLFLLLIFTIFIAIVLYNNEKKMLLKFIYWVALLTHDLLYSWFI